MPHYTGPLLTRPLAESLTRARDAGTGEWTGSLDLGRSTGTATLAADHWQWKGETYAYPGKTKDRTLYYWDGEEFLAISRFGSALIKLVPTDWDAPTFEIDGIKMLPSAQVSPFEDARRKVA
ncbi:MAG: SAM-dependent methyltransferase, partial [Stenotrophomonas bentonitica]